ncbi:MAG: hypothetical protein HC846_06100 [Blastocatellia bacterium]|nr:hypothetical protein [Blastocatellia bacterium]
MNIQKLTLDCNRCLKQHNVEIDFDTLTKEQKEGKEPVLNGFICPDTAFMYRALNFSFDLRVNSLKDDLAKTAHESITNGFKTKWGEFDFNSKLDRFIKLDIAFIGIPEEYYELLWAVVSSYCCGYFYPAMTGAGSLGERILNRLILKTRDYFKLSKHYKNIYRKGSFDNWDYPITVLNEWLVISDEVVAAFQTLKQYRNDSIHYKDGYDFQLNSYNAIKALSIIIDKQFNYITRKDLFWVFDIPGEIWLKSAVINEPFVREFVLPHCIPLTPYDEPLADPPFQASDVPLKPLSDKEFIRLRNSRK